MIILILVDTVMITSVNAIIIGGISIVILCSEASKAQCRKGKP